MNGVDIGNDISTKKSFKTQKKERVKTKVVIPQHHCLFLSKRFVTKKGFFLHFLTKGCTAAVVCIPSNLQKSEKK
jgi:hypothetical protein